MNDHTELENELRKLRPLQPSAGLLARIEEGIVNSAEQTEVTDKIVRPDRFRISWPSIGFGLAAAAILLLLTRVGFQSPRDRNDIVSTNRADVDAAMPSANRNSPAVAAATAITPSDQFLPSGATQVVYNTRDEGLMFRDGSEQPLRRFRSRTRETLQWRNAATGASLRVSYPSEQVELIPVSGQ